ncbi:T9SS type A sorting domain-containing protein [Candidatus Eisenbacteria bacterium]|uniref:T9SS type A sorting domain-containing protein n=1 Tax=Eiseniibacteriota bacterium TaxID=2212470 RepID=A0ABV6YJ27_UNCEI
MQRFKLFWIGLASLLILLVTVQSSGTSEQGAASRANSPNFILRTAVIGSAGSPSASESFQANGTQGQSTPVGVASTDETILSAGFWRYYLGMAAPVAPMFPEILTNALYQNYPNPFNPSTTIRYSVAQTTAVSITVYNAQGRKVRTLVDENQVAGHYRVTWDGKTIRRQPVASGVYFYSLRVGPSRFVKKMLLLK